MDMDMDNEYYDELDDYTVLTYLAECGFRFSQNGDGSEFIMLRGRSRGGICDDDNWYYSLQFTNDIHLNDKYIVDVEYNHKHTNNKYSYAYVNNIILPSINDFIENFGILNKYNIFTFCVKLVNNIKV
jgi:hypothetical protein